MATALDLITSALRKISVLGNGSSLDATEADQALETLNAMLSSFSVEGCMAYEEVKETFNLTGASSYTIGSGLDFDTTAPTEIIAAYTTTGSIDYPLKEIGEKQYAEITQKNVSGDEFFYYDGNFTTPRLYLYPVPTSGTITLYSRKPLSSFSGLSSTFSMPEQYKAMIIYNLAVWIAPEYSIEASATTKEIAEKTKKTVKVQNNRNNPRASNISDIPDGKNGTYNIYRGY